MAKINTEPLSGTRDFLPLDVLRRVFPYLDCDRVITGQDPKPCLYFHIKRCAGPCIGAIDRENYRQIVDNLCAFLEGNSEGVLQYLTERMQVAAERLQFERAAQLRDQIRAAGQIVERQKVVSGQQEDEDVIAFAKDDRTGEACVQVFFIRRGKLIGRESFAAKRFLGLAVRRSGQLTSHWCSRTKPGQCARSRSGMAMSCLHAKISARAITSPRCGTMRCKV